MKCRPILFGAEMIRAILDKRKTQTRRPIKPQPVRPYSWGDLWVVKTEGKPSSMAMINATDEDVRHWCMRWPTCPQIGDRFWVRETWAVLAFYPDIRSVGVAYRADGEFGPATVVHLCKVPKTVFWDKAIRYLDRRWRPSIHMPRWISRITLEVAGVRVERLQEITQEDARAEGAEPEMHDSGGFEPWGAPCPEVPDYIAGFASLWDSIYAKRGLGWDTNPWVRAIKFRRIDSCA